MFTSGTLPHFIWDEVNLRKIAAHDIERYEVEEVFIREKRYEPRFRRAGKYIAEDGKVLKRYKVEGQAFSGRRLRVIFDEVGNAIRPVTAYSI